MGADQRQHSVSFDVNVRCKRTLHINDYTDDEVFSTWYSSEEYKAIKQEAKATVAMMEANLLFEEDCGYATRGLEDRTACRLARKVRNRYLAIDTVLEEQDRQRESGIYDPQALSLAYTEFSFACHMTAFLVAASDAAAILSYEGKNETTDACFSLHTRHTNITRLNPAYHSNGTTRSSIHPFPIAA